MRRFLMAGVVMQVLALPAFAQTIATPPPAADPRTPPAVVMPPTTQPPGMSQPPGMRAPDGGVPGANSFTEAQARSRLEGDGFTSVSALSKDKDGIWRGRASKGSAMHDVGVDYQGNIIRE